MTYADDRLTSQMARVAEGLAYGRWPTVLWHLVPALRPALEAEPEAAECTVEGRRRQVRIDWWKGQIRVSIEGRGMDCGGLSAIEVFLGVKPRRASAMVIDWCRKHPASGARAGGAGGS